MIDRRQVISRAAFILGGAISSSAIAGVLAGCDSTAPAAGDSKTFLTAAEAKTVGVMADHIIPRTDTPGAIDAGVPAFIDRMMAGYYQDKERAALRAGLALVEQDAQTKHGRGFAALTPDDQIALMKGYDGEAYAQRPAGSDPHFFRTIKELTIIGFCMSEAGATKFLRYEAVPGPYRADIPYSEIGKAWAT